MLSAQGGLQAIPSAAPASNLTTPGRKATLREALMARRRSVVSAFAQMQRDAARANAAQMRAETAARREADRAHAAFVRAAAADERERKRLYAESRSAAVAASNAELDATVQALGEVLTSSLGRDCRLSFASLKQPAAPPAWQHGHLEQTEPEPDPRAFTPPPPTGLSKMFGSSKHEQAVAAGQAAYAHAVEAHRSREANRVAALGQVRADWQAAVDQANAKAQHQHREIDALEAEYHRGDPDAVISYSSMVLEASRYLEGFPQKFKLA